VTVATFKLPSPKRAELLELATTQYAECVDVARTYLQGRGLTDEVIDRWQLGYVLDPLTGHEKAKGRVSIPYLTRAGTVEMKFRCIQEHDCKSIDYHDKYWSESGSKTFLFGAQNFWRDSPFICVTEGEMDAIAADVAGLPAVGISGASKWLPHWAYCFEGYEEVIVLADGDKAGEKLASNVGGSVYAARVVTFPDGEDVNSYLIKHGPQTLRRRVLGESA
jgi:DNA primase